MVMSHNQCSLNFIKSGTAKQISVCAAHTEKQYAHTHEYHKNNQPYKNYKKNDADWSGAQILP